MEEVKKHTKLQRVWIGDILGENYEEFGWSKEEKVNITSYY